LVRSKMTTHDEKLKALGARLRAYQTGIAREQAQYSAMSYEARLAAFDLVEARTGSRKAHVGELVAAREELQKGVA
jgi:predicted metalloprotease with PDZ domain